MFVSEIWLKTARDHQAEAPILFKSLVAGSARIWDTGRLEEPYPSLFLQMAPGVKGLLHVKKTSAVRVPHMATLLTAGEKVKVGRTVILFRLGGVVQATHVM